MRNSLQWRLSFALSIGVTLLWILSAAVTGSIMQDEMDEVFDHALQAAAQQLLQPIVYRLVEEQDEDDFRSESLGSRKEEEDDDDETSDYEDYAFNIDDNLIFIARNRRGDILLKSQQVQQDIFPLSLQSGFQTTASHRIFSSVGLNGAVIVSVADPLVRRTEAVYETLLGLAWPLLILLPLSLLGAWFIVRQNMRALQTFKQEIEARDGLDLKPIEIVALPSEIKPVADAVNQLLMRLERTLKAERSFSANSAHELRTPVAAALAQTQRLIVETQDVQTQDRAAKVETSLKSLAQMCEKLLQLARAEGGALRSGSKTDVIPVLHLVLEDFRAQKTRLILDLPDAPVLLAIDTDAFAILVRNLIENALKHGIPEGDVQISLGLDGTLSVANKCSPIPSHKLERLARPFERGSTPASGSGLGLAIVASIVDGIGAKWKLSSSAGKQSASFVVTIHFG